MPPIEPGLVPVVTDLERGLRELGIPFGVVGALVPELLLDARPAQVTNDADVAVVVQSLADFETLKDRLADYGFTRTRVPHRMQHRSGGFVDLLPFSESIAPGAVAGVLDRFSGQDADVIGVVAREKGRLLIEDEREQIFEHFRWYRLGAAL